mgnify:CR=1 FL=1
MDLYIDTANLDEIREAAAVTGGAQHQRQDTVAGGLR